jgi:hypothetical protein
VIAMPRIDSLIDRLKFLEAGLGYVTLLGGSKFRPIHSGIRLYRSILKTELDLGKKLMLSDFSEQEREEISNYSKWSPVAGKHGTLRVMVSDLSREVVDRSRNEVRFG